MGQSGRLFSSCSSSSWIRACDVAALMMTLSLLLVLSAHEVRGAADTPITFGMSTPLNTSLPAAELGLRFSSGIKLAFDEVNSKFGGINGHPLNLLVQEDYYNLTITMQNVGSMIAGGAFAIAGVIGAEQAQGAAYVCNMNNVPLIGPYTGNYNLYNPFNRLFVNIRASYADEVNTLLSFLSNELRYTKVSAFYQNESIQVAGFTDLNLAFNLLGLKARHARLLLVSQGVYDRNAAVTLATIQPAVLDIYAGGTAQPQAIACIGTYAQIVIFIQIWRSLAASGCTYCRDTTFVMASFVGPELFSDFLKFRNVSSLTSKNTTAMYISQVVPFPNPAQSTAKMVAEYTATKLASTTSYKTASFTELEGYLVGRLIVDALFRMRSRDSSTWNTSPDFDTSTSANRVALRKLFLDTIYDVTNTFNIAGLTLGPYSSTCNQGMRQIYMVALEGDYSYIPIPSGDYAFPDVCGSQTSDVARPLAFGQSADFSGERQVMSNKVRAGIQAAFGGYNTREGGFNGRQLLLISYDDRGNSTLATENVNTLITDNNVFGIMGSVGEETVKAVTSLVTTLEKPLVGPVASSPGLRDPWIKNVINIRGSVADETTQLVNYMSTTLKKYRVVALWSNDTMGADGLSSLLNSLDFLGVNLIANASYDPATGNITSAFASIKDTTTALGQVPEAVFLYGTQTPLAKFILLANTTWPSAVFFATSSASAEGLSITLASVGVNPNVQLYMSSVVPYPWDDTYPIVSVYLSDMATAGSTSDIGFASLEGYINAAFAEQVLDLLSTSANQTGKNFVDAIYSRELFAFQGLRFGAFGDTACTKNTLACKCNQGLHQTWMIKLNSSLAWSSVDDTLVWTGCEATSEAIGVPLVFGQILPFTSQPNVSNAISNGVYAAFGYLADNLGQNLTLISRDSDLASAATHIKDLSYDFGAFALVGLGRNAPPVAALAAERGLPSIGSISGASSIRDPYNRLYVNIRGSYADSAGAAISFLSGKGIQSVAVVHDANLGDDPVDGVNRAIANFSMTAGFTSYNPNDYDLQSMVSGAGSNPAILMFGYEETLASFVQLAKTQKASSTIYIAVGLTDPDYFNSLVVQGAAATSDKKRAVTVNNVYATSAVPPLSMTDVAIVSEYLRDVQLYGTTGSTPTSAGLEAYIAGRLVGEVFKRDSTQSRESFLNTLYNFAVFNISSLRLGPYGAECSDSTCNCNQGMRQVWIGQAGNTDGSQNVAGSTYEFSACGVVYPTDASSSSTNVGAIVGGVVGGVVGLLCCLAIIGALLFFLFIRNYRKREKQLAYALQNTPLSMLENSLVEMENEMAQMSPFDGENSILYQINDAMFPIQLDKTFLDFGVDSHKQCPINTVLGDVLMLENTGREKVEFRFHHTLRNHKMSLLFTPNRGTIKPGKAKEIKVELVMKITTTINEPVVIEAVDQGHIVLNVKKEAELSTMLDYEEITINGPPIGVGGFGKVFRGHWRGAEVAVKVLRDQNPHIKELTQFKNEIEMVNKLRHKNIVNFIGAVTVPGKMCMVTEYIKMGSLQAAIHGNKKMSKLVKAKIALDVANGMNFLHQSGILHRDLKPDNVLITSLSGKADINAKLTDFGTSRAVGAGSEDFTFTKGLGTPIYMSPEILGHQDYTEKADVYSFAIMLWALVAAKEPYSDFKNSWDIARYVTAGKRLEVPKNAGALMNHLITACWAHTSEERPSFDEIVQELQSYVNVKKYGGDEASGEPTTEGDASSYGFGSRANESRGISKTPSGGKSSKNNTRNSRNTTRNTSSNGSGGPPSKNTSAFGFGAAGSRGTTREGYAPGIPAPPPATGDDSSDDSSDDSDVAGDKGKAALKSKLKKAGKNVTWDEKN